MGRHNGSWSKFHPQLNDHEKTARAARVLIEGGVAPEYAAPVVILSVLRLAAWALGDGDTGETTTLLDGRLAGIAWPEAVESKRTAIAVPTRVGALLRAALRTAGFLDHDGKAEWIHDFVEVYLEVINRRRKVRRLPPIVPEQLRNNRRGSASISPELFRLCHVPGGSGSGSGSSSPPTPRGGGGEIDPPPDPGAPGPDPAPPGPRRAPARRDHAPSSPGDAPSSPAAPPEPATPPGPPRDPLAVALAERLRWKAVATVEEMLAELRGEGFTDADLRARIDATPTERRAPWEWAKATRRARGPRSTQPTDSDRAALRRSAERFADLARDAERAGDTKAAHDAWNAVRLRAHDLGVDAAEFGAPHLTPSGSPA